MEAVPGLALLGAGLFARDQYVKVLKDAKDLITLRFVWSRTKAAAEEVAAMVANYSSAKAVWGEEGLQEVLECPAIHAVAVVLPAQVQLQTVMRCLRAGKHVLQEKPIAISVADAATALAEYRAVAQVVAQVLSKMTLVWAVAENYRFEPALIKAAEAVKQCGKLMATTVVVEAPMTQGNPYFASQWRRDPAFTGAFLTDGGVHFIAGLRLITGAEPVAVSAFTKHLSPLLPPPDNLVASLEMSDGSVASMTVSYSATSRKVVWRAVCENGTVEVERGVDNGKHGYSTTVLLPGKDAERTFYPFEGVRGEIVSFARTIHHLTMDSLRMAEEDLKPDPRGSNVEAIRDLAAVEAMVKSGAAGGARVAVESIR